MAELADARDLKSLGPKAHPGSIPGLGTKMGEWALRAKGMAGFEAVPVIFGWRMARF
jgi:hypothetical protein